MGCPSRSRNVIGRPAGEEMTWNERQRPQSIEIPVRGSNEVVEVFLDDLPADPSEIRGILREEAAPIDLFLHFAIEYYYQGKFGEFRYLLKEGLAECSRRGVSKKTDVPLLTALAAFHISLGLGLHPDATSGQSTEKLFDEATMLLNEAERHDQTNIALLLRKGLLLLAQRKLGLAEYQLKMVTSKEPDSIAAHVALGVAAFLAGEWRTSLGEFQTVLRQLPSSHETVRMAIGHCMLRLGRESEAEVAFERVLALNPRSVKALVAMASLYLNRGPKHLAKGMQLLKQAYDIDKTDATVLCHLANHFFFKKDYAKATSLAHSALHHSTDDERRADASYMLGKIQHAQAMYMDAFMSYSEAVKLNPNLMLAQLGLGQVCLQRGDLASAADCFDRVVTLKKGQQGGVGAGTGGSGGGSALEIKDAEFWAMLGMTRLCATGGSAAEALMKTAISLGARSFDLFVSYATLHETKNVQEALKAYDAARAIDATRFASTPELLNNYAVMLHQMDRLSEASAGLAEARARASPNSELFQLIRFNEARLLEDVGRLTEAEGIYKELAQANPNDVGVHLRLGIICARRGQHSDASEHYKEAIGIKESEVDAWILLASNHMRIRALTPARKAYERILKQHDRHEVFSLTALGNIYVEIGRHERRPAAVRENMRRSLEFFIKALQLQPNNYVAANGVGVVFAELGRYKEAKDIFLQTRQAAPVSFVDATMNLAHCFVELGQHAAAIHAYESLVSRLHGHRLAALFLFLARASYVQAKGERDPSVFRKAIEYLERAQKLLPDDPPVRFNLALCQQEVAAVLLKRGVASMTDEDVMEALSMLDSAQHVFTLLGEPRTQAGEGVSEGSSNKGASVDAKVVEQRRKYCQTLKQSLQSRLDAIRAATHSRQAKLDVVRQQREESLAAEAAQQAAREEAQRREQERHEAIRKELAAKLRVTEEVVRRGGDDDDLERSASEEEQGEQQQRDAERPQRRRKRRKDAGMPRKRRAVSQPSEEDQLDEDDEEVVAGGRRRGRMSKSLSKEFISQSESEDEQRPLARMEADDE